MKSGATEREWTCLRCGEKIADFGSVCWCSDECMVGSVIDGGGS